MRLLQGSSPCVILPTLSVPPSLIVFFRCSLHRSFLEFLGARPGSIFATYYGGCPALPGVSVFPVQIEASAGAEDPFVLKNIVRFQEDLGLADQDLGLLRCSLPHPPPSLLYESAHPRGGCDSAPSFFRMSRHRRVPPSISFHSRMMKRPAWREQVMKE